MFSSLKLDRHGVSSNKDNKVEELWELCLMCTVADIPCENDMVYEIKLRNNKK